MSYAKARKHHRVAKKSAQNNSVKGIFLPHEHKNKLCILTVVFLIMVFIKGILLGFVIANNEDN